VEGNVTLSDTGNGTTAFGADNALVFLGQGPLRIAVNDDTENPGATGVVLRNARIAIVETGGLYAVVAQGQIEIVGISGLSIAGFGSVRFNNTGVDANQSINFTNSDGSSDSILVDAVNGERSFAAEDVNLEILGQQLSGNFSFDSGDNDDNEKQVTLAFSNVSLSLGDGTNDLVTVEDAQGVFLVTRDGVAGTATTGTVELDLGPDIQTIAGIELAINTTGQAVVGDAALGTAAVAAGPFVRLAATSISLEIAGQTITGHVAFEQATTADGDATVALALTSGELTLGDAITNVDVENGTGFFFITSDGIAGTATVTVTVTAPGVTSATGTFELVINTTGAAVSERIAIGGQVLALELDAGPFLRIAGTDVQVMLVAGTTAPTITGNFAFEQTTDSNGAQVLAAAVSDVSFSLGSNLLTLTNGFGLIVFTDDGMFGQGAADLSSSSDDVELAGTFGFTLNTTGAAQQHSFDVGGESTPIDADSGNFLQIIAMSALILLAGVQLSAQKFRFTQESATNITINGANAGFSIAAG
ncbi:MAG: hypothetical protein P8P20_10485, partial [Acidimicrobiales bacterium]|nr:hypothetical protein [Acidimicrobiales bacterium]